MTTEVPGLRYVTDATPGLRRRRSGRGFVYLTPDGDVVRDQDEIRRIKSLAIPPAWTDVWVSPQHNSHIQATGRDAKGRKQYKYHPKWRQVRDEAKFERTTSFAEALPALRRHLRRDMSVPGLPKEKVLATVVALLDCCFARVGNEQYAKENNSFGLTTLRDRHARFDGSVLRLSYVGKGGKRHTAEVDDRRIAHIVKRCQEIPGQELFQYVDADEGRPIGSADVNDYLRDVTGSDFSAKDFRTWAATVACAAALAGRPPPASDRRRQRRVLDAVDLVASCLGNTRSVCRASYIHPDVIEGYLDGGLHAAYERRSPSSGAPRGLSSDERFTLAFLKARARSKARRGLTAA